MGGVRYPRCPLFIPYPAPSPHHSPPSWLLLPSPSPHESAGRGQSAVLHQLGEGSLLSSISLGETVISCPPPPPRAIRGPPCPSPYSPPPPQVSWENAVIIFDEAHNVEGVCSDASSFDITGKSLADAMQEAKRCAARVWSYIVWGEGVGLAQAYAARLLHPLA